MPKPEITIRQIPAGIDVWPVTGSPRGIHYVKRGPTRGNTIRGTVRDDRRVLDRPVLVEKWGLIYGDENGFKEFYEANARNKTVQFLVAFFDTPKGDIVGFVFDNKSF